MERKIESATNLQLLENMIDNHYIASEQIRAIERLIADYEKLKLDYNQLKHEYNLISESRVFHDVDKSKLRWY